MPDPSFQTSACPVGWAPSSSVIFAVEGRRGAESQLDVAYATCGCNRMGVAPGVALSSSPRGSRLNGDGDVSTPLQAEDRGRRCPIEGYRPSDGVCGPGGLLRWGATG